MSQGNTFTGQRFLALDGLRGVAAIVVVVLHLSGYGPRLVPSGYLAVDLFFMLSGFVLARAYEARLLEDFPVFRGFMLQRFIRLWPLYAGASAIGVAFFFFDQMRGRSIENPLDVVGTIIANAFFLPTLTPLSAAPDVGFPFNQPGWSLFCEIAVNLGFALMLKVRWRPIVLIAFVGSVVGIVIDALHYGGLGAGIHLHDVALGLVRATFGFLFGVLLYRLHQRMGRSVSWPGMVPLLALAFVLISVIPAQGGLRTSFDLLAVMFAFPVMLLAGAAAEPTGWMATLCETLGSLSYPLYVIHAPVQHVFDMALAKLHWSPISGRPVTSAALVLVAFVLALGLAPVDRAIRRKLNQALRAWATSKERKPAALVET